MSPIDKAALTDLLTTGPYRTYTGGKQLTLAFAGLYLASTTITAKPHLIWETEKNPYARYYIPVESLHQSIKAKVDPQAARNGDASSDKGVKVPIGIETLDTVQSKNSQSQALIERLSVGTRSSTWVRFTEGPLKGLIRFERNEIDDWFENGAIFGGIKSPFKRIDTEPVARNIVVKVDGEIVAESNVAVVLTETGLKEAYYIPATSILDWGAVEKSTWRTQCPYKGEAWYLNLTVNRKKHENIVWYYQYPTHESAGVEGFISFYNKEGVETLVDGVDYSRKALPTTK